MKHSIVSLPVIQMTLMTNRYALPYSETLFIEADIFTADLREMLQKQFGGCGVGFVTITSMTSGYRPTVRHTFGGWSSHAVTDSIYFDKKKQGISGHYFVPGTELM